MAPAPSSDTSSYEQTRSEYESLWQNSTPLPPHKDQKKMTFAEVRAWCLMSLLQECSIVHLQYNFSECKSVVNTSEMRHLVLQRCGADTYIPANALEKVRTLGKGSFSLGEHRRPRKYWNLVRIFPMVKSHAGAFNPQNCKHCNCRGKWRVSALCLCQWAIKALASDAMDSKQVPSVSEVGDFIDKFFFLSQWKCVGTPMGRTTLSWQSSG